MSRSGRVRPCCASRRVDPAWRLVRSRQRADNSGQAAVELAMVLPLIVALLMLLLEAGLVARDQVMVVHAAREAARVAAVDPSTSAAVEAARSSSGLDDLEVLVRGRGAAGSRVTVTVRYREPGRIPMLGAITSHVVLEASATMRVEGDTA